MAIIVDHGGQSATGDALAGAAYGIREGERQALLVHELKLQADEIKARNLERAQRAEYQQGQLDEAAKRTQLALQDQRMMMEDRAKAADQEAALNERMVQSYAQMVQDPDEAQAFSRLAPDAKQAILRERQAAQMEQAKAQGVMTRAMQMARSGMFGAMPMAQGAGGGGEQGPGPDGQPLGAGGQIDPQTAEVAGRLQMLMEGLQAEPWRHEEYSKTLDGIEKEHGRIVAEQETRKRNAVGYAGDLASIQDTTPGLFGRGMVAVGKYTRGEISEAKADTEVARVKWLARTSIEELGGRYEGAKKWRDRAINIYDAVEAGIYTADEGEKRLEDLDEAFDKTRGGLGTEEFELAVSDFLINNPRTSRQEAESAVRAMTGYGPEGKRTLTLDSGASQGKAPTKQDVDLDEGVMRARKLIKKLDDEIYGLEKLSSPNKTQRARLDAAKVEFEAAQEAEIQAVQKAKGGGSAGGGGASKPDTGAVKAKFEELKKRLGRIPTRQELKDELTGAGVPSR